MSKENSGKKFSIYQKFFKRFFDILFSLIGLIVLSPIFIIIYITSLIVLKGNPIFKQYRPGKNNKIFAFYKFRSMTNKTDESGNLLPDKDRITTYGKILRKLSLDEIPQLINILKGDMSFVGPRPRLVKDVIFYDQDVLEAYSIRPGLTGPAQVYDRNSELSWESVFERDKEYAKNVTFINDMKLIFKTFAAVLKGGSSSGAQDAEKSKKREYYYGDYLLKSSQITKDQYDLGIQKAQGMNEKNFIEYQPELHNSKEKNGNS